MGTEFVEALPDRPKRSGAGRGPSKKDVAFLLAIKSDRTGAWGVYAKDLPPARASQLATAIRKGKRAAFRDETDRLEVEVITGAIYVRYSA